MSECQNVRIYVKHLQQQNIMTSRLSTWSGLCQKNAKANHPMLNNAFSPLFDAQLLKKSIFNVPIHSFYNEENKYHVVFVSHIENRNHLLFTSQYTYHCNKFMHKKLKHVNHHIYLIIVSSSMIKLFYLQVLSKKWSLLAWYYNLEVVEINRLKPLFQEFPGLKILVVVCPGMTLFCKKCLFLD